MIVRARETASRSGPLLLLGLVAVILVSWPSGADAQAWKAGERLAQEWDVKAEKMNEHLLPTMREHGVDMWIIMSRENNPDPALDLFGDFGISGWYGQRNAYVFTDPGTGDDLETVVFGTHLSQHLDEFYDRIVSYHGDREGLAPLIREYVHEEDPETIAINQSRTISMADGLTAAMKEYLENAIGPEYSSRLVSSEPMFIDYVSRRTQGELEIERQASEITWNILRRAFSNEVITPGETTLMDLHWWIVNEWKSQDLELNFPPGLDIQRRGVDGSIGDGENPTIRPGDVLHVDFGVKLMGLVTDQQKMAYVLKPGEEEPPEGLKEAFANSVRGGEFLVEELKPGVKGYQVMERAERRARAQGLDADIYPHVQGNWVHGVGAWGSPRWPERYGIHPKEPVRPTEFWSIEYSVTTAVPEWGGQEVSMAREEDARVTEDGDVEYLTGPQEELWLIRTPSDSGGDR